jgi:hypothetical protein
VEALTLFEVLAGDQLTCPLLSTLARLCEVSRRSAARLHLKLHALTWKWGTTPKGRTLPHEATGKALAS